MSYPKENQLTLYCSIMVELKARLETVRFLPTLSQLGEVTRFECCYLQLRMLCELIALACMVAHGDISATKKLRTAYAADDILNALENMRPQFYPQPVMHIDLNALKGVRAVDLTSGFLTKRDLLRLYREAGGFLHRGTIEKLEPLKPKVNFPKVSEWLSKIQALVAFHRIALGDERSQVWFVLNGLNGRPSATLMRRED